MVGLVIVSHSARLADGVAELARGMAGPDVQIAAAGGMDLPERPLGTDMGLIARAIEQVYSDDGVIVLVDLGSAILSTEMALETFPPEKRQHIALAPAALVEGSIAAAVQARLGSPLETVVREARTALDAKLNQFEPQAAAPPPPSAPPLTDSPAKRVRLTVANRLGLHARPAARFVQTAAQYKSEIYLSDLTTARGPANAKSINAVTTLGVTQGHEIEIGAAGDDADAALVALKALADDNFGDKDGGDKGAPKSAPLKSQESVQRGAANEYIGLPASPGYAIGAARQYQRALPPIPQGQTENPNAEWTRLQGAIEQAMTQLRAARHALNGLGDSPEAEIFDAQVLMLQDAGLQEPARAAIFEDRANAAAAIDRAANEIVSQYEALQDEYLRARAADVRAVTRLVLLNLVGAQDTAFTQVGILIASDLTPAETAVLDPQRVQGICTAHGAPTGHSAILAKSLGIPAVVGLGEGILQLPDDTPMLVDGTLGRVWRDPDAELLEEYRAKMSAAQAQAQTAHSKRHDPAVTRDGKRVEMAANIGSLQDAEQAVEQGAEAVGLFRTEFLFLDRREPPSEEEQYETYHAVASALRGRSLLIRTLDIGGDKPLPYVKAPREANPFLGLRGLRLCLAQPELFLTQLRAILRVADAFPLLRVMFPMVATLREYRAAVELVQTARAQLKQNGKAAPARIETGIMVEVPSAALLAEAFAREVDFFSIGTNDLTQYTLAAERGNPSVAQVGDSRNPAVLQLIARVVEAAHREKKWVGVCGEMAGDPQAIPLLVGLGVDELSMSAPLIPAAKEIVRGLSASEARERADALLKEI